MQSITEARAWVRANGRLSVLAVVWAVGARLTWEHVSHHLLAVAVLPGAVIGAGLAAVSLVWAVHRQAGQLAAGQARSPLRTVVRDVWREEARRTQLTNRWARACAGQGLVVKGKSTPPPLLRLQRRPGGDFRARLSSTHGVPVTDVMARADKLAEVIGCLRVKITPDRDRVHATVDFIWEDRLEAPVLPGELRPAPAGQIVIGRRHDGTQARLSILNRAGESIFVPMLIGAVSGGGKSGALWAILAGLIFARIPLRLYVHDGAGGVELAMLEDAIGAGENPDFTVVHYAGDSRGFLTMMKAVNAERLERLKMMRGRRLRAWKPTREHPLTLVLVDEISAVPAAQRKIDTELHEYMVQGRKSGHSIIVLTQLGEKENIGALREAFRRRVALATKTVQQTVAILGGEIATAPGAHGIPEDMPGVAFMEQGERIPTEFRFAFFSDPDIELIARGLLPASMSAAAAAVPVAVRRRSLRDLLPVRRRQVPADTGAVQALQEQLEVPVVAGPVAGDLDVDAAIAQLELQVTDADLEPKPEPVPQHAVLRLYGWDGDVGGPVLQLVEATPNPTVRFDALARRYRAKPADMRWWADVQRLRQMEGYGEAWRVVTWHDSLDEALRVEAATVAAEKPRQAPRRKVRVA